MKQRNQKIKISKTHFLFTASQNEVTPTSPSEASKLQPPTALKAIPVSSSSIYLSWVDTNEIDSMGKIKKHQQNYRNFFNDKHHKYNNGKKRYKNIAYELNENHYEEEEYEDQLYDDHDYYYDGNEAIEDENFDNIEYIFDKNNKEKFYHYSMNRQNFKQNVPIYYYMVELTEKLDFQESSSKTKTINCTKTEIMVKHLKPRVYYEFCVKVISGDEQSICSLSVVNKTKEMGL